MKKRNYIKMSFMSPTSFLPKRIKLENASSKVIINIPLTWNMSDFPYLERVKVLLIHNNIKVMEYLELKNNEFIFIVDGDNINLKLIDII